MSDLQTLLSASVPSEHGEASSILLAPSIDVMQTGDTAHTEAVQCSPSLISSSPRNSPAGKDTRSPLDKADDDDDDECASATTSEDLKREVTSKPPDIACTTDTTVPLPTFPSISTPESLVDAVQHEPARVFAAITQLSHDLAAGQERVRLVCSELSTNEAILSIALASLESTKASLQSTHEMLECSLADFRNLYATALLLLANHESQQAVLFKQIERLQMDEIGHHQSHLHRVGGIGGGGGGVRGGERARHGHEGVMGHASQDGMAATFSRDTSAYRNHQHRHHDHHDGGCVVDQGHSRRRSQSQATTVDPLLLNSNSTTITTISTDSHQDRHHGHRHNHAVGSSVRMTPVLEKSDEDAVSDLVERTSTSRSRSTSAIGSLSPAKSEDSDSRGCNNRLRQRQKREEEREIEEKEEADGPGAETSSNSQSGAVEKGREKAMLNASAAPFQPHAVQAAASLPTGVGSTVLPLSSTASPSDLCGNAARPPFCSSSSSVYTLPTYPRLHIQDTLSDDAILINAVTTLPARFYNICPESLTSGPFVACRLNRTLNDARPASCRLTRSESTSRSSIAEGHGGCHLQALCPAFNSSAGDACKNTHCTSAHERPSCKAEIDGYGCFYLRGTRGVSSRERRRHMEQFFHRPVGASGWGMQAQQQEQEWMWRETVAGLRNAHATGKY